MLMRSGSFHFTSDNPGASARTRYLYGTIDSDCVQLLLGRFFPPVPIDVVRERQRVFHGEVNVRGTDLNVEALAREVTLTVLVHEEVDGSLGCA